MYSFVFNIPVKKKINIVRIHINGHEITTPQNNATSISQKIDRLTSDPDSTEKDPNIFFSISIPEFDNSFICSENDYKYFSDIFNKIPIQITVTNKEVLKIFARELEIEELKSIIDMFEKSYDIFTTDSFFTIQKEIIEKMLEIDNDNYGQLIDHLCYLKESHDEINNDFLYNIVLTTCLARSDKIELLMNFLKEFEIKTKSDTFQYFKKLILSELKDNDNLNEIRFIVRHLYSIKEISEETIISSLKKHNDDQIPIIFRDILYEKLNEDIVNNQDKKNNIIIHDRTTIENEAFKKLDFLNEYALKGSNPDKIFQSIKNDDLDSFSQLTNEDTNNSKYRKKITTTIYERSSDLVDMNIRYIDLCAFFGSEKIFNFILMNESQKIEIKSNTMLMAVCGGNSSIIHQCSEMVIFNPELVRNCILKAIQYNHNEVFEWLVETYQPFKTNSIYYFFNQFPMFFTRRIIHIDENILLKQSIRYNNLESLSYLFSIGIDYQPLFSISMLYNNFYLARLALKLPYNCNYSSKKVTKKNFSPFFYNLDGISIF